MCELQDLKKQIDQKGWHDFYELICIWKNANTEEEKIEIAKQTLTERFPYGYTKPDGVMGYFLWNLELKKNKGET